MRCHMHIWRSEDVIQAAFQIHVNELLLIHSHSFYSSIELALEI